MIKIVVENNRGDMLSLHDNSSYIVTSISGLNPANAIINTSATATFDGSTFKGSRVGERNIVLEIVLANNIENSRLNLYKYFRTKSKVTLYLTTQNRDVYTIGYVESFEVNQFVNPQRAQISLVCPWPYFIDVNQNIDKFSITSSLFEFPFSIAAEGIPFSNTIINSEKAIVNNGDVESGVIINLYATGTVLNPKIYNEDTNEYFILDVEMNVGDVITINTNKGQKRVTHVIDGVDNNIINRLRSGSSWFILVPGDNLFLYTADEFPANLHCEFIHSNQYGGV